MFIPNVVRSNPVTDTVFQSRVYKPMGMSQGEAVFKVMETLDPKSSVHTLVARASEAYGGDIHYNTAVKYRTAWCKSKGIFNDCRRGDKYGQPKRDQHSPNAFSYGQLKAVADFCNGNKSGYNALAELSRTDFNSYEQFQNCIQALECLQLSR